MQILRLVGIFGVAVVLASSAVSAAPAPTPSDAGNALTIYNQNFAVVRQTVPLDLTAGVNHLTFNDITAHVEPDSVILRDPAGRRPLQVLEQNYRADPITQDRLLALFEGQTIDFQVPRGDQMEIIPGKIIRSGYVPVDTAFNYNQQPYYGGYNSTNSNQPIIEVNGKLQFTLPGTPLFPALPDDSILKPTLDWTVQTDQGGPLNAELAYVTDNMSWKAAYNVVAPVVGNDLDITGWVTMDNQSGKTFTNAKIKLMAGDVSKLQPQNQNADGFAAVGTVRLNLNFSTPPVTEKNFDEYHLYTLARPTTLRNHETKQVEFTHAGGVHSTLVFVYDGLTLDPNQYNGWSEATIRGQQDYGTQSNPKVWIMREIVNSQANGLGIPLPAGRMRFYRQDTDGQLEFIGENDIDHTPKDETLRVYTGNAFDITGNRTQTKYSIDNGQSFLDESFSITLHNHKATPVAVRVVEHLYRGSNWAITEKTDPFVQKDARTIEFPVMVASDSDKVVTYTVHYTW